MKLRMMFSDLFTALTKPIYCQPIRNFALLNLLFTSLMQKLQPIGVVLSFWFYKGSQAIGYI